MVTYDGLYPSRGLAATEGAIHLSMDQSRSLRGLTWLLFYRYSFLHNHLNTVQYSLPCTFNLYSTLPYPAHLSADRRAAKASVIRLSPDYFRHLHARPVSCYALFKWWLLLSQHPGCLSTKTSFTTERIFGTLAVGLGSFPFDNEDSTPLSEPGCSVTGIRSLIGFGNPVRPLVHSVLYPPSLAFQPIPKYISRRTRYLPV